MGLNAMYEKSLSQGTHPEELKQILTWLAFSERPMFIEEIADVVIVDLLSNDVPVYNPDLQLFAPSDILDLCSGFVTLMPRGEYALGYKYSKISSSFEKSQGNSYL